MVDVIDNIHRTLEQDLKENIRKGSKISMASACFSIYAFQELKKQLEDIDELKFIFTSPTFVTEKAAKERKEFYIPRLSRERSLYGTEFEIKLRNELSQKAIARECSDWIREKVSFRSNVTNEGMNTFLNVSNQSGGCTYSPIKGFTTVDLGCERGNNLTNHVIKLDHSESKDYLNTFDTLWNDKDRMQDVTEQVLDSITAAYVENPPEFIYFVTLYNIFNEFLEDISADYLPNEGVGFRESQIWNTLYPFQRDAVLAIVNKLETYNGCILADSVGLGKTFTALAVIKYYESRNKNVLVLCPKKLSDNWNTYKGNYRNNILNSDRLRYDVLYHTDLSRKRGMSNGINLATLIWENYDLVVIDESHNFRNGGNSNDSKENRYTRLLNDVVRKGVQTKVLMLSATPVNNRFYDLKNQLEIAFEGNRRLMLNNLNISSPLEEVFKQSQKAFNRWSSLDQCERTTDNLLKMLDFDFFTILDSVTIARSRRHIEKYYGTEDVGKFPTRLKPKSYRPNITDLEGAVNYQWINDRLTELNLAIYVPTDFLLASARSKYVDGDTINRSGREQGIRRLMSIALLKRLESSVYSFNITVGKVLYRIEQTLKGIDLFEKTRANLSVTGSILEDSGFDPDLDNDEIFAHEQKTAIPLEDMDYISWKEHLERDRQTLITIRNEVSKIGPKDDKKLLTLIDVIREKVRSPINPGNRKVLVFSAFTDTTDYLYDNLTKAFCEEGFNVGTVSGSSGSRSTIRRLGTDFNDILTCFSPISKNMKALMPDMNEELDILIGTDCISEGQNLQDCDFCINYDIHWNPVRIIQRFGRVDRIGSQNDVIQLVNFWPDVDLDEYIKLKSRVETRMKVSILTSTGDDDLINEDEHGDLEYRKQQLKRLQEEVVDIEEMQSGISIMDLGLNEFRLDLLDYVNEHGDLDNVPMGLHAVVPASHEIKQGVLFVLKNINPKINIDKQNRLHPFYMIYISNDGEVICDHLSPKKMLDFMRYSCKGKTEPVKELCALFNRETKEGKDMRAVSELLSMAIESVIETKGQSDLDSFLGGGNISFKNAFSGLEDFELICFLVVR